LESGERKEEMSREEQAWAPFSVPAIGRELGKQPSHRYPRGEWLTSSVQNPTFPYHSLFFFD
jgi:hypothetical protein